MIFLTGRASRSMWRYIIRHLNSLMRVLQQHLKPIGRQRQPTISPDTSLNIHFQLTMYLSFWWSWRHFLSIPVITSRYFSGVSLGQSSCGSFLYSLARPLSINSAGCYLSLVHSWSIRVFTCLSEGIEIKRLKHEITGWLSSSRGTLIFTLIISITISGKGLMANSSLRRSL